MAERLKLAHSANQFWINTVLQNTEKKVNLKVLLLVKVALMVLESKSKKLSVENIQTPATSYNNLV